MNRIDSYELLTMVYDEDIMNQVSFYKWYKASEEGRESITDELRDGRRSTSRTEVVNNTVAPNYPQERRITVRELNLIQPRNFSRRCIFDFVQLGRATRVL